MPATRLTLTGVLRLGRPSDIWFKPALSVVVATAPPNLTLLALGRLDLALYTMAGSLCALYAHNRPYAARARVLAGVIIGMTAGLGAALLAASLTANAVVLVTVGALLAAVQKTLCDAVDVGPPGHVVLCFISSGALFLPQTLAETPGHLGLTLAAGAWAWVVCMAPGLLRPHGPERRAVAQALRAAADTTPSSPAARARAVTAIRTAWRALSSTTRPDPALEHLLIRAEVAVAAPAEADVRQLRLWADELRGAGAISVLAEAGLVGTGAELASPAGRLRHRLSQLAPVAVRTALGCALAGYASLAVGIGRPYWTLVTAASLYQANVTLTWNRAVQRVVGNLVGVVAFAVLVPLAHLHAAALVLCCLALSFGAEALISRNYWLGSVCVTPMALLITEFARVQDSGQLVVERVADTLVGAVVGFAAAAIVTNRRAGEGLEQALARTERARAHAVRVLAGHQPPVVALESARRALTAALADLRSAADTASGEWWQHGFPQERVTAAEQAAHRTLATTARRQGFLLGRHTDTDMGREAARG